jgi:dTDP-4-dehydrorhamnose reductase
MNSTAPDAVVHCAAETRVDLCQRRRDHAMLVNAEVPGVIAAAAHRLGAKVVFVSSDAVFDGASGGYEEGDPLCPVNVYGESKAAGEKAVAAAAPNHIVVRTNLYGWNGTAARSLAMWVLDRLRADSTVPGFTDVVFNPLFADDLAELLLTLVERDLRGVYHLAASDHVSKFEFGRRIAALFGFDPGRIVPVTFDMADLSAPRPRCTWLNVSKIESVLAAPMPSVDEGLRRFHLREPRPLTR